MNINSNTGGIVGQSGQFGSRMAVLNSRHKKDEIWLGAASPLLDWAVTQGYNTDKMLFNMERDMGYNQGSLSWGKSVTDNYDTGNILLQDNNGNFVEMNLSENKYKIRSEKDIVEEAGIKTTEYDKLKLDQGGFSFYKFFRTGLGDGSKDYVGFFRQQMDNLRWGLTSVIFTEVDENDETQLF